MCTYNIADTVPDNIVDTVPCICMHAGEMGGVSQISLTRLKLQMGYEGS